MKNKKCTNGKWCVILYCNPGKDPPPFQKNEVIEFTNVFFKPIV